MSLYYHSVDPRIKRIKQQEKEAREAKKRGIAPGGAPAKKTKKEEEEEKKKKEEEAKQKDEEDKVCVSFFFLPGWGLVSDGLAYSLPVQRRRSRKPLLRMRQRRLGGSRGLLRMLRRIVLLLSARAYLLIRGWKLFSTNVYVCRLAIVCAQSLNVLR